MNVKYNVSIYFKRVGGLCQPCVHLFFVYSLHMFWQQCEFPSLSARPWPTCMYILLYIYNIDAPVFRLKGVFALSDHLSQWGGHEHPGGGDHLHVPAVRLLHHQGPGRAWQPPPSSLYTPCNLIITSSRSHHRLSLIDGAVGSRSRQTSWQMLLWGEGRW